MSIFYVSFYEYSVKTYVVLLNIDKGHRVNEIC
jgi:hypothetical protein